MKPWILAWMAAVACSGCTMMSLERHTVAQADSAVDLRYREVLDNLAMTASDPSALPSYASIFSGTIFVQDQGQIVSTNIFPYVGAVAPGSISANPSFNRQISQNWALDPIGSPEKLEAIRAACQWEICGPDHLDKEAMSLLIRPDEAPAGPERHFGVAEKLAKLPVGWLYVGRLKDVPACVRYKAHCGDTWVWVTSEGMKGLADFTVIIQDIARVSINSQTLFHLPPVYTPIVFETADTAGDDRSRTKITVQVVVDQSGHLVTNNPYSKWRLDNLGSDSANFRSAIGAAGISAVPH